MTVCRFCPVLHAGGVPASYAGQYCLTLDNNNDLCGAVAANLPCFMRIGTDLSKPLYECHMFVWFMTLSINALL